MAAEVEKWQRGQVGQAGEDGVINKHHVAIVL